MITSKKLTGFFFGLAVLAAAIYCIQYTAVSVQRGALLSGKNMDEREQYIEKEYRYEPVYRYAKWLDSSLLYRTNFSLYAPGINYMYYYTRLNYFLWPKFVLADVRLVSKMNDGDTRAERSMKYGEIVFALSVGPQQRSILMNGKRYDSIARFNGKGALFMERGGQ